jgi:hypothetical protein
MATTLDHEKKAMDRREADGGLDVGRVLGRQRSWKLRLAKEEGHVNILGQPRLAPTFIAKTTVHAQSCQPASGTPDGPAFCSD